MSKKRNNWGGKKAAKQKSDEPRKNEGKDTNADMPSKGTAKDAPKDTAAIFIEWPRNGGEAVRLTMLEYKGQMSIDLRIYYRDQHGNLRPTKRGVRIPFEQLASLRKALRKVEEALAAESSRAA